MTESEKIICKMYFESLSGNHTCNEYHMIMNLIDNAPTDNSEITESKDCEHETGFWIYSDEVNQEYDSYKCSACNKTIDVNADDLCDIGFTIEDMKYCPNCGAKMLNEDGESTTGDLISREAVLEHYRVVDPQGTFVYCSSILEFIKNLPDAEPERKIGRLTKHEYFYGTSYYSCSECDNRMKIKENYCSHCGAKLVEADE